MGGVVASGMSRLSFATSDVEEGQWTSELFGDEVTWNPDYMSFRPDLSEENDEGDTKWADCYLGIGPDESVALAMVRLQELPYADLEELAAAYPGEYFHENVRERYLVQDPTLTDDAFGFFYMEDPAYRFGGNWCYYAELAPPAEEGGAWSEFLVSGGVQTGVFDLDVLAANGEGVEINGQPTYRAWSFDQVLDSFTAAWEEHGRK